MRAQQGLFGPESDRSLLDVLLGEARLYTRGDEFHELLEFVARLRNFAPFNAMLLQIQKPGLTYAASAVDWEMRFGRRPKPGARPLLILWPFGPVALVYDVVDTEGEDLPGGVSPFQAEGPMDQKTIASFGALMAKKEIHLEMVDSGDARAGVIQRIYAATKPSEFSEYRITLNRNHAPGVQFTTIAHELGHLYLGHQGNDEKLEIPDRSSMIYRQRELEAESVAYLVSRRNGVTANSQRYLSEFVGDATAEDLEVYQIMRAAGQVESLLGLAAHTKFPKISRA